MTQTWPVEELVPHTDNMILIDHVLDWDDENIRVAVTPRADGLFNNGDTVPAWVGIEYMAQSIAAHAGILAKRIGEPIKLGFLLGTRHYESSVTLFQVSTALEVEAHRSIQDENGLGVYQCRITGPDILVEANINVFQPEEVDTYLRDNA